MTVHAGVLREFVPLADDFYKDAKFCSLCGPKFCSINVTQHAEVRDGKEHSERQQKFVELFEGREIARKCI
jgi:hypothetical protein